MLTDAATGCAVNRFPLDTDAVATLVLGTVECLVGGLDHGFGKLYFKILGSVADADGH